MPSPVCNDAISFPENGRVDVRTAADIEASAHECGFCRIILNVLVENKVQSDHRLHITRDSLSAGSRATHGTRILVFRAAHNYTPHSEFVVRNLRGLDRQAGFDLLQSGRANTGSEPVFRWAEAQIEACQAKHEPCKVDSHSLPDRVLYLGHGEIRNVEWIQSGVSLYESSGEDGKYVTLSHRWGTPQPIRLLGSNLNEFRKGIPWTALPTTFQQAIMFTRNLGILYLWIDSLCIIQDSAEDWRAQSARMAAIYEQSFVTLAASIAENAAAGCFVSPPSFMVGYLTDGVSKAALDSPQGALALLPLSTTGVLAFVRETSEHPMPSRSFPLLNRGWVYQERLLSPRILHFAQDLIFECSCHIECYCKKKMGAASRIIRSHPPKLQHLNALGRGPFKNAGGHPDDFAYRWCTIIEEYSSLHLTYASDRLPGLAGLAKQMSRYMPEATYVGGVWSDRDRMPAFLAWRRNRKAPTAEDWRMRSRPLWSWVTMPGGVSFPRGYPHLPTLASGFDGFPDLKPTINEIEFDHHGDPDFLSLNGGSIHLSGYILEVQMQRLQTEKGSKIGVVPALSKTNLTAITLDGHLSKSELNSEWQSTDLEWARELAKSSHSNSLAATRPEWPANVEYEFRRLVEQGTLQSALQCTKRLWAFCLGKWQTDTSSMDQFLVLEYVDESSNSFRRIGQGECSVKTSLFRPIGERQEIVLT